MNIIGKNCLNCGNPLDVTILFDYYLYQEELTYEIQKICRAFSRHVSDSSINFGSVRCSKCNTILRGLKITLPEKTYLVVINRVFRCKKPYRIEKERAIPKPDEIIKKLGYLFEMKEEMKKETPRGYWEGEVKYNQGLIDALLWVLGNHKNIPVTE